MSYRLKTDLSVDPAFKILHEHPLPTWVIDARDLSVLFSSKSASEKYGIKADEFLQLNFLDIFTEESRLFYFQHTAGRNEPSSLEGRYSHIKNDGKKIDVELYASCIKFNNKDCYQVSCVDITGKTNEGQKLQEESLRYKTYIDHSSDGIYCQEFSVPLDITSSFGQMIEHSRRYSYIAECNDAMARMYGYEKADDLKGALTEQLLDFSDNTNLEFFRIFIDQGFRIVNATSHEKDRFGNTRYFLNNAMGVIENGFLKRIWGTQQDITEKKRTEEKLQLLANLVEQSSDIITASDNDFRPVTWNKAAERIYGISAEQVIGKNFSDFIEIRYENATRQEVRDMIRDRGSWSGEACFTRPSDLKKVVLMITFKKMIDDNGLSLGYLVTATDITERKIAESKLKESENRFRNIADSSPVMIWMTDENDITTYTNRKWIEFTGIDIKGKPEGWANLVHKDDLEKAKRIYDNAFEQKKQVTIIYRLLHKSCGYRWVHDVSVPRFSDGKFIGFIGSVVDIEDQKQKEQQLRYQSTILENVSDIIIATDPDFKVKSWNASAEFYYGIKEKDALGKRMSEMLRYDFRNSSHGEMLQILQAKGQWKGEITNFNEKGE
ncbi:MAG TPA: PAS domain S-box protein, partial [Flavisolibacter sp.]